MKRTYLFVPAINERMIEKAVMSHADCVILDLEDAVPHSEKEKARQEVEKAILTYSKEKPLYIRINGIKTPFWKEDIAAIKSGAAGMVVPKVESDHDIKEIVAHTQGERAIIPQIESAKGIQHSYDIAKADPSIERFAFGSLDFAWDIDCELTEGGLELLFARSQLVIASRAAGIASPIDTVYPDFHDHVGLEQEAIAVKQLGFKAKLIIHPKQIDPVNKVFSPSQEEIEWAKQIVKAFEQANDAAIQVDGKMVDLPVYKKAKDLLEH